VSDDVEVQTLVNAAGRARTDLVRGIAILELVRREDADSMSALITLFDRGDPVQRRAVLASLGSAGTPRHLPLLDAIRDRAGPDLQDLYSSTREAALGRMN